MYVTGHPVGFQWWHSYSGFIPTPSSQHLSPSHAGGRDQGAFRGNLGVSILPLWTADCSGPTQFWLTVEMSPTSSLRCVPSAVQWVRPWVWHRVSPSGSAVLRHQRQAHPGSANAVEGELARGRASGGEMCDVLGWQSSVPVIIIWAQTKLIKNKARVLVEEEAPVYWMWHPGMHLELSFSVSILC